jgi:hypothetical protein
MDQSSKGKPRRTVQAHSTPAEQIGAEREHAVTEQGTLPQPAGAIGGADQRQTSNPTDAHPGRTPSDAPNASFAAGAGPDATGFDSPPITSSTLSDADVAGPEQGQAYFPPGGAPDRKRSDAEPSDKRP